MTSKRFNRKLQKAKEKNKKLKQLQLIKKEKNKYKHKIETSKVFAFYLFLLFNSIIVYSMYAMWFFADLSQLGLLITGIAAEVLTYAIYCMKAHYGKKEEEKIKYIRDKNINYSQDEEADNDGVG